jgi:hypothetical protein
MSIKFRVAKTKTTLVGQGQRGFPIRAQMVLRGADGEKAKINFYRPGQAMPEDQLRDGVLYIGLPEDQIAAVLMLLREEPVYVGYHNGHGVLSTLGEEVGEEVGE